MGWRRVLVALCVMAAALPLAGIGSAAAEGATIRLPRQADVTGTDPLEGILLGSNPVPTKLPGSASDREVVRVDVDPDGTPRSVEVVQRLMLTGTGDFAFRLAGPATQVQVLPESQGVPALRRGSVIWQGFVTGQKLLGAELTLDPATEATRLPIRVEVAASVGGRPAGPETRAAGAVVMTLTVTNVTSAAVQIPRATGDRIALARTLDRIAAVLRNGRVPQPGADGVPRSLHVGARSSPVTEPVEVPFEATGTVLLPAAAFRDVQVEGGQIEHTASGFRVGFSGHTGGTAPDRLTVRITATTSGFEWPTTTLSAGPTVTPASVVAPPGGGTWSTLAATGASGADPDQMLRLIMRTMWEAARFGRYAAYIGNPDPTGPSDSNYLYRAGPAATGGLALVSARGVSLPGLVAVVALSLFVLFGLSLVWARS